MDTGKTSNFNFKGHRNWTRTLPTDSIVPVSLPGRPSSSWPFAWDCASGLFVQSEESRSMASEFGRGWICLHPRSNNLSRRWRTSCHCIGLVCVLKSTRLHTHIYCKCLLLDVVVIFLLSGNEVPQDYLRKSWDAILKSKGFKTEDVHSIEFFIYRFELAASRNLEASSKLGTSTWRLWEWTSAPTIEMRV